MDNKNIWIINQYAGSPDHGMVFRSYYLAEKFINKNCDVTIITASYSHVRNKNPVSELINKLQKINGIKYFWVKIRKYNGSKSIGRIISLFEFPFKLMFINWKDFPKPDVIIVSSASPIPVINAWILSKKYKAKLIFEIRDLWPLTLVELGNIGKFNPLILLFQVIENFACRVSDRVVSVLENSGNYLVAHGMPSDRFSFIPNGIDIEKHKNQYLNIEIEKKLKKICKNKFIVGYAGSLGIANSMDSLIEAAKILVENNKIHFIIIGDGPEKVRLMRLQERYSLGNVTFIDPVLKNDIPAVLKYFDIAFIGWIKTGLYEYGISPNKIFEYMYNTIPILISIDSDFDIVTKAKCGLKAEAENPASIADNIIEFYKMSREKREILGNNGKKFVIKNHSYSVLADKYMKLF